MYFLIFANSSVHIHLNFQPIILLNNCHSVTCPGKKFLPCIVIMIFQTIPIRVGLKMQIC